MKNNSSIVWSNINIVLLKNHQFKLFYNIIILINDNNFNK